MKALLPRFAPHEMLAAHLLPLCCDDAEDGAHDLSRILRVWQNVRRIMAVEGGDAEILTAATLLHDCVNVAKDSPQRAQASRLAGARNTIRWTTRAMRWIISRPSCCTCQPGFRRKPARGLRRNVTPSPGFSGWHSGRGQSGLKAPQISGHKNQAIKTSHPVPRMRRRVLQNQALISGADHWPEHGPAH